MARNGKAKKGEHVKQIIPSQETDSDVWSISYAFVYAQTVTESCGYDQRSVIRHATVS